MTGSLDLVDINENHIIVTDYKTGKPSRNWKGNGEYEKIKLHKYRQQLMFYQLLCERSRDFAKLEFDGAILQFVEPTPNGEIVMLDASFSRAELEEFAQLIKAIWRRIIALDLPDISNYPATLKGILQFEQDLLDKND